MITDLEPDILECKVKWALGSITMNKPSGGDGIPLERFQILKDDAVKVPEEGKGNPLQYSCLANSMDRGAWQAIVHGVTHLHRIPRLSEAPWEVP